MNEKLHCSISIIYLQTETRFQDLIVCFVYVGTTKN